MLLRSCLGWGRIGPSLALVLARRSSAAECPGVPGPPAAKDRPRRDSAAALTTSRARGRASRGIRQKPRREHLLLESDRNICVRRRAHLVALNLRYGAAECSR